MHNNYGGDKSPDDFLRRHWHDGSTDLRGSYFDVLGAIPLIMSSPYMPAPQNNTIAITGGNDSIALRKCLPSGMKLNRRTLWLLWPVTIRTISGAVRILCSRGYGILIPVKMDIRVMEISFFEPPYYL